MTHLFFYRYLVIEKNTAKVGVELGKSFILHFDSCILFGFFKSFIF